MQLKASYLSLSAEKCKHCFAYCQIFKEQIYKQTFINISEI